MRLLPRRLRPGEEASLVEHLGELRSRLVWSIVALLIGFSVAFTFHDTLIGWLNRPLADDVKPTTFAVAEPFMTSVIVSLWAGFALALPVVLYNLWGFFAPAFEHRQQRLLVGFVAFATTLFLGGLAFAYYVALPKAVNFLTSFDQELYDIQIRARDYYSFVLLVLVAVATVFELPIFVLALARLGIVPTSKLRRNRRIGYILVACLAVALPGVDPVTLMFTMLPLMALFECSIWLAVFFDKRWERKRAAEEAAFDREDYEAAFEAEPRLKPVELDAL